MMSLSRSPPTVKALPPRPMPLPSELARRGELAELLPTAVFLAREGEEVAFTSEAILDVSAPSFSWNDLLRTVVPQLETAVIFLRVSRPLAPG